MYHIQTCNDSEDCKTADLRKIAAVVCCRRPVSLVEVEVRRLIFSSSPADSRLSTSVRALAVTMDSRK